MNKPGGGLRKDGEGPYCSSRRFPDSIHHTKEDDFIIKLVNTVHKRGYIVTPQETPQVFILGGRWRGVGVATLIISQWELISFRKLSGRGGDYQGA